MPLSPQTVCDNLDHIEDVDLVEGATYREQAYTVLTDDAVSTTVKEEVCEHLNRANQLQALTTVNPDESY
ncbi:MAG: hypothetical protein AB4042_02605 [Leptolyngbyaceae cyanobacterium]